VFTRAARVSLAASRYGGGYRRDVAIELTPVTRENVRAACELRVADAQTSLIAPAAVTIAEAHYYQPSLLRAIARDGTVVGLAWVTMHEPGRTPFLVRFMVDAAHRASGVGGHAIALLEDELRTAAWTELKVSFVPVEPGARGFWERCGFAPTGRLMGHEPVYRKDL
jgi:diamine N-acetyltransferase